MFSNRMKSLALSLGSLLVLTLASSSLAADGQPEYQQKATVQNIFENHVAYMNYTGTIDDEYIESEDFDLTVDLVGEAYSASLNYLQFLNGQTPKNACQWDFWLMSESIVSEYAHMYGSMYFQLTAQVGEAVDFEFWVDHAFANQDISLEMSDQKCWNKLDA